MQNTFIEFCLKNTTFGDSDQKGIPLHLSVEQFGVHFWMSQPQVDRPPGERSLCENIIAQGFVDNTTRNHHSKSVEFEPNLHRFFKICENLAQIPQIWQLMKRCR